MRVLRRWFSKRIGYPLLVFGRSARDRKLRALLDEKRQLAREPLDTLRRRQLEMLKLVVVNAGKTVPFYRRRFQEVGFNPESLQSLEDLARIPPLTKDDIREHLDELVSETYDRSKLVALTTGGSTGVPVHLYADQEAWMHWEASALLADECAGWQPGEPIAMLWGAVSELSAVKTLAGRARALVRNQLVLNSLEMSRATLADFHARLTRFRPALLVGYGSSLGALAWWLKGSQIGPVYPRVSVVNAAEPLYPERRALIETACGAPVFDRYGTRDAGPIAMECEAHAGLHINAVDLLVEPYGGRTGEPQELLITNLNAYGAPLIRYRIDDLAVFSDRVCPCGRGTPLLERIVGRVLDIVYLPGGGMVHGGFFFLVIEEHPVIEFQIVQDEDFSLTVRIVKAEGYTARDDEHIRKMMAEHVQGIPIRYEYVTSIDRTPTGKLRPVLSKALDIARSRQDQAGKPAT